jgi:SulP family sulfate permease
MPHLALPSVSTLENLLSPAFTIALLAAIESLLSAVVADGMIGGDKHDSNTELIAQGLANIASASVGGLPVTGALARTAANIRCGGRSPVAGVVAALTVLAIMAVAAPLAAYIPLPALSAVLVLVAINMGEWRNFSLLPGWPRGEAAVFLFTFALTVLTDVTVAVEAGLALSAVLYLKRIGDASGVSVVVMPQQLLPAPVEEGVRTLQLSGALVFGSTGALEAAVEHACGDTPRASRVLLLDCSRLMAVDVTGLEALEEAQHAIAKAGARLVLAGLQQQPHAALSSAGFLGAPPCVRAFAVQRAAALTHARAASQSASATPTWCATKTAPRAQTSCWRRCAPPAARPRALALRWRAMPLAREGRSIALQSRKSFCLAAVLLASQLRNNDDVFSLPTHPRPSTAGGAALCLQALSLPQDVAGRVRVPLTTDAAGTGRMS